MTKTTEMQFHEFVAERVCLYAREQLTEFPALQDHTKLEVYRHQALNLVMTMTSWCVAGRVPTNETTEVIEWPDGVWQMFKSRFMPYWFVSRFPVRHIRREIKTCVNHYFVCPHVATDPQEKHVRFMATGTPFAYRSMKDANSYER